MSHAQPAPVADRGWAPWVGPVVAVVILGLLLARLGTAPFVAAVDGVSLRALALTVAITAVTTACCAWRWTLVARGLDVGIRLPVAFAAYYRSQFLNSALPGGILGDVHRAVRHGHDVGAMGRSARSVVWERVLGQAVQVVLTVLLLIALPSPLRGLAGNTAGIALGMCAVLVVLVVAVRPVANLRITRAVASTLTQDLRRVLTTRAWPVIVLTSAVAVAGHVTVFLIAMQSVGVEAPVGRRVAVALVVLLAAAVPTNLAGWGPREGAAAWVFDAAGMGAATGVTVAVLYGVLALVATLPGVLVLLAARRRANPSSGVGTGAEVTGPPAGVQP